MRSSVILSIACLGANAVAAPHAAAHKHKRDTFTTWTQGNDVYIEDIHVVTAVVSVSQTPPQETVTTTSVPAAGVHEKIAIPAGHYHSHKEHQHQPIAPVGPTSSSSAGAPVVSAVSSTPTAFIIPVQSSDTTTTAMSTDAGSGSGPGSATGTGPVPGPSNIDTTGSQNWTTSPNSMGKSILGTANYWRTTWNSALPGFVWDATLAGNSRATAVNPIFTTTDPTTGKEVAHNEGGANVMNHNLNPGSLAQCENEGDGVTMDDGLTPFEQAWLGWLCEEPNSNIPCDKIGETGNYNGDTGHADIIKSTSYTKMGCYYQDGTQHPKFVGIWTCDFA